MNVTLGVLRLIGHALRSRDRPLLAHLVVTRRCNLSCGYCNEYDRVSPPVPTEALRGRVRQLSDLKTAMVACSGGEPLLHPEIEEVIREIRDCRMVAMMSTNGYLLTRDAILALNDAGLQVIQISIDNVEPDEVSAKSLRILESRLEGLARFADFEVTINSVLGIGDARARDAVVVARYSRSRGFSHSVGLAHDDTGALRALGPSERAAYGQIGRVSSAALHSFNRRLFQRKLVRGEPNRWQCRAGARFLYICEDGLVHYCSQRRGWPAIPLEDYTVADIRRSFQTEKACSPLCTLNCVHQVSALDRWRRRQPFDDPAQADVPSTGS